MLLSKKYFSVLISSVCFRKISGVLALLSLGRVIFHLFLVQSQRALKLEYWITTRGESNPFSSAGWKTKARGKHVPFWFIVMSAAILMFLWGRCFHGNGRVIYFEMASSPSLIAVFKARISMKMYFKILSLFGDSLCYRVMLIKSSLALNGVGLVVFFVYQHVFLTLTWS